MRAIPSNLPHAIRLLFAVATLTLASPPAVAWADPGPSLVNISGRQVLVQRRNPDGTLQPAIPFIARGVNYSPASKDTNTRKEDLNNVAIRRNEFGTWYGTDLPLIQAMKANVIRLPFDPGLPTEPAPGGVTTLGAVGRAMLDEAYSRGIYVLMTVDDGINDLSRVRQAVCFYKDHPALLGWILGNEINIWYYYGAATSITDAVQRTQTAAALIKTLDANHPVFAGYGEIDINDNGRRLSDTAGYITECPSVDAWLLNIYRGDTFNNLFTQWASITTKPMVIGEFGADSFHTTNPSATPPSGSVNEAEQRDWDIGLWNEIFQNLSAADPSKVALGGCVFAWADEWWKISGTVGAHNTDGFHFGMPDGFSNEEYFGLVDIDRAPRLVYTAFQIAFDPGYVPPPPSILTVTNLNDSGAGSLRQALLDAAAGDRITFSVTGTISLTSGELVVSKRLNIEGPGSSSLVLARSSGAGDFRVLNVTSGPVVLSGVSVSGGRAVTDGGALRNTATLTLRDCAFNGNFAGTAGYGAGQGGAVWSGGTLTVENCSFDNDSATGNGGAIRSMGTLIVSRSSFTSCSANFYGGAIFNFGPGTLDTLVVALCSAPTGGAIWNENQPLALTNSTLHLDWATNGGALANKYGAVSLTNVTISACSANQNGGAVCNTGISNEGSGTVTLSSCTIAGNYAGNAGGGLYLGIGTASARNSILANNSTGAGGTGPDCDGTLASQDFNLIRDPSGCTITGAADHNLLNLDPQLGTLQNNGGATPTLALLDGSPAIDAGSSVGVPLNDQRGQRRPLDLPGITNAGDGTDIGAFELRPSGFSIVTISASAAWAAEYGPVSKNFAFSRTGDTAYALTIYYSVGGTASSGDFATLGSSITIPARASEGSLLLTPVADTLAEGAETVLVSLIASSAYDSGLPSRAAITIADLPLDDWRWRAFGANANNSSISGALADPDHDGLVNLLEYAFGSEPLSALNPPPAGQLSEVGGQRFFSYLQLRGDGMGEQGIDWTVRGVRYVPQISTDLQRLSWSSGAGTFQFVSGTAMTDDLQWTTVRIIGAAANSPTAFARLLIQSSP